MQLKKQSLLALPVFTLFSGLATAAPVIVTTDETVGGTILNVSLDIGSITVDGDSSESNDVSGNFVFSPGVADANTDWNFTFNGLNVDPTVYIYFQIDVVAVSSGAVDGNLSLFWSEVGGDSGIGGVNNSSSLLGPVSLEPTPFSIVLDLTNGGTSINGAKGWGDTDSATEFVNNFRLDFFEGVAANKGESFTIGSAFFGTELVPEPSSLALLSLGGLLIARRRRG